MSYKPISIFFRRKYFALIAIIILLIAAGLFANWQIKADTGTPADSAKTFVQIVYNAQAKELDKINGMLKGMIAVGNDSKGRPYTTSNLEATADGLRKRMGICVGEGATPRQDDIYPIYRTFGTLNSSLSPSGTTSSPVFATEKALKADPTILVLQIQKATVDHLADTYGQGGTISADGTTATVKVPDETKAVGVLKPVEIPVEDLAASQQALTATKNVLEAQKVIADNRTQYLDVKGTAHDYLSNISDPVLRSAVQNITPATQKLATEAIAELHKAQDSFNAADTQIVARLNNLGTRGTSSLKWEPKSTLTAAQKIEFEALAKNLAYNNIAEGQIIDRGRSLMQISNGQPIAEQGKANAAGVAGALADPKTFTGDDGWIGRQMIEDASTMPASNVSATGAKASVEQFKDPIDELRVGRPSPAELMQQSGVSTASAASESNVAKQADELTNLSPADRAKAILAQGKETADLWANMPASTASDRGVVFNGVKALVGAAITASGKPADVLGPVDTINKTVYDTNPYAPLKPADSTKASDYNFGGDLGLGLGQRLYAAKTMGEIAKANPGITSKAALNKPAAQQLLKNLSRSSIGINPATGHVEYTTRIFDAKNPYSQVGYMSFDPISQKYTSDLTTEYAGKFVRFYAAPRTGDTYVSISNANDIYAKNAPALLKAGNLLQIMAVSVTPDGSVGGSFKLFNRMFAYNPATKAFEVKIKSLLGESSSLASKLPKGFDLTIDSRGTVTGNYNVWGEKLATGPDGKLQYAKKDQLGVFFDSDGNMGATYSIKSGRGADASVLGGVSLDIHGNIGGSINLGKIASASGPNVFLSFDQKGVSGITASVGHLSFLGTSTPIGIGFSRTGGLSIGISPFMLAGIPLPIGISMGGDAHGNLRLTFPIGSVGLGGSENRDLSPPEIQQTSDGASRLECIFFYHSLKKGFLGTQTIRVWNTDSKNKCPLQIDPKEQIARSNKIFSVYNRVLGRNPTYQEFYSWYFYSAGNLAGPNQYPFEYSNAGNSDYRTIALETQMRQFVTASKEYKNKAAAAAGQPVVNSVTQSNAATTAQQQAQAVVNGTPAATDIMAYNPFDPDQVARYQAQQQVAAAGATTTSTTESGSVDTSLQPFFNAIEQAASQDPYFHDGVYTIPGTDTISASTSVTAGASSTASATESATSASTTNSATSSTTAVATTSSTSTSTSTAASAAEEESAVAQNNALTDQGVIDHTIIFKHGFSTVFVPRDEVGWDIKPFADKSLIVYDFNPDGSKVWKLSSKDQISFLKPGIGYYVYNADTEDVSVVTSAAGLKDIRPLRPGWNLLANSTSLYAKLTDLLYQVPKPDQPNCAKASCMMKISLFDMFSKTISNSLAYKNLFLIKDSSATSAEDAFETIEVTPDNADNLTFAPGDTFWLYKWK